MSPAIVFQYFNDLSSQQQMQFQQMGPIYQAWNDRLNLISRKDIENLYLRHVLHSLSIAKVVTLQPGARVLDVGTGGGFPGVPLAIMFPNVQFHLVDAVGKKIRAVQGIVDALALDNVATEQMRAEHIIDEKYDFVLGRAVKSLSTFYGWIKNNVATHGRHTIPNGVLYLQGEGQLNIPVQHHIYKLKNFFEDPFFATKQLIHLMPS